MRHLTSKLDMTKYAPQVPGALQDLPRQLATGRATLPDNLPYSGRKKNSIKGSARINRCRAPCPPGSLPWPSS